jgi:AcrR family transcriptional regulator
MCQPDTKQRILDSAEEHFASVGYHATSLRSITTTAEVNLAAVNYHFGSKEALLEAVILRRLRPLNELRGRRLDEVLQQAEQTGEVASCRDVLRCFIEPTLQLRQQGSETENFIALIGRALADPKGHAMAIFAREMQPLMQRLFQALSKSLPALSQKELFWKVHFAIGSLSHVMRCSERHAMVPADVDIDLPIDELVENFLDFTASGMEA